MTNLPPFPNTDTDHPGKSEVAPKRPSWIVWIIFAIAVLVVIAMVALHLSGVIGTGAH